MIGFIDDHRAAYGVEPICRVLPIAPSTYHAHAARRADPGKLSARARRDAVLQADIKRVWEANFQLYGVRKVWRQLRREAIAAPRCQVARLMKRMGLAGAVRGRTVKTTQSDRSARCPLDRLNRQFRAPASECPVGVGFHLRRHLAGLCLCRPSGGAATGCFADGSPRGDCHRRVCPAHRRLARVALGPHRLRVRCAGTGLMRSAPGAAGRPGASQRSRRPR